MISKFPNEIIFLTINYIDFKDIVMLSQVNTLFNNITKDNLVWKNKCLTDYKKACLPINCYFSYYKFLYKNLCMICFNKTDLIDYFYKDRICFTCQKTVSKYMTYCKSDLKRDFFLKDQEINNINNKTLSRNNESRPYMYLFLKTDVEKYISKNNLEDTIIKRKNKKVNDMIQAILLKSFRYNILHEVMYYCYDLEIDDYRHDIQSYCGPIYKKYINSCKYTEKDNDNMKLLVQKYLELRFLKNKNIYIDYLTHDNFKTLLLYYLLKNELLEQKKECDYITFCIAEVIGNNISKFRRKEIIKRFNKDNGLIFDVNEMKTWFFIYYGG